MNDIVIPSASPDFDSEKWQGTLKQLLSKNIGKFVRADYNADKGAPLMQQGVIYAVGTDYLLLWDETHKTYSTGDLNALRSLVFFPTKD